MSTSRSTFFGVAFLVLVPVSLLGGFLNAPASEIWNDNRALFTGGWFLYNFFGRNIVEAILSRYSVLFQGMKPALKRQDATILTFAVGSVLWCIPAGGTLVFFLFRLGPLAFIPRYGSVTRCLISMGIAGEFVDLLSRHRLSTDLVLHHTVEVIAGGIMVDSTLYGLEPGFLLLAMMTVVGRGPLISVVFDHVRREGSSDTFFPDWSLSREGCRTTRICQR